MRDWFLFVWLVVAVIVFTHPEVVGAWLAYVDMSYNEYMAKGFKQ